MANTREPSESDLGYMSKTIVRKRIYAGKNINRQ